MFRVDILVLCRVNSFFFLFFLQEDGIIGLFFGWLAGWENKTVSLLIHLSGLMDDHRLRRFYLCNNISP